jgi:hypothetical protein
MSKLTVGLIVIILIVVAIVVMVMYWTSPITGAAASFFVLIREGKPQEAYQATTREFQASTSEQSFMAFLKSSTIGDYESATWSSRSVSGNTGELQGSIRTRSGGVIPLKVTLVHESGAWRIHALERTPAGLVAETAAPGMPAENELTALTNTSVVMLARAVTANNFAEFHQGISQMWRDQATAEELRSAYLPLIDQKFDFAPIEGKTPEFTEKPVIDDKGRLILKGRYPLQPAAANFTLKFIYEKPHWKLLGLYFSREGAPISATSPSPASEMPSDGEVEAITNGSMMLLATALSQDDFSAFYDAISKLWQGQTTKEKLRDQFKVFLEKKISLTLIQGTAPVFTDKPVLDDNRLLILAGQYPTKPYRVEFRLKFIREQAQWRLVGINVTTAAQ